MKKRQIFILVGTRPNFIKVTQFERVLHNYPDIDLKIIHAGQHYSANLSDIFFKQFNLRKPDYQLEVKGISPGEQIGKLINELSILLLKEKPHLLMVVGDVNSTLAGAIAADKCGIRIAHLESGLRSFDLSMPEEKNRILTDFLTQDYFITEQSGLANLSKEFPDRKNRFYFVGNTMIDTLVAFDEQIRESPILRTLGVSKNEYALVTIHRPRNVDKKDKLENVIRVLNYIAGKTKLIFPIHPRTIKNLKKFGSWSNFKQNPNIIATEAMDYFSFQNLILNSQFILTDSGGIQEEATFRHKPCLTLRPSTERPSTVDIGSNTLLPMDEKLISNEIEAILSGTYKSGRTPQLWDGKATERIGKLIASDETF